METLLLLRAEWKLQQKVEQWKMQWKHRQRLLLKHQQRVETLQQKVVRLQCNLSLRYWNETLRGLVLFLHTEAPGRVSGGLRAGSVLLRVLTGGALGRRRVRVLAKLLELDVEVDCFHDDQANEA